jgi:acetyl-CoA acetyltransferase
MTLEQRVVWLAAGVRTPFANFDGALANRDAAALSVPVAQAMASRVKGPIDFEAFGLFGHYGSSRDDIFPLRSARQLHVGQTISFASLPGLARRRQVNMGDP